MVTAETVVGYIHFLCSELGIDSSAAYNPKTGAWYFAQENTTIEVFLTEQKNLSHQSQVYIRCMAPLCEIPRDFPKQFQLYKTAMAINSTYLGYKLSADEARGIVCAVSERNIEGMDYAEMITLIRELAFWAGKLNIFLRTEIFSR